MAKTVAILGLAALGQVPTPGPVSSVQGSCGLWAELIHWEGLWAHPPTQPRNSNFILQLRTLQGLKSQTALSNMAHRNILFALLVCCLN